MKLVPVRKSNQFTIPKEFADPLGIEENVFLEVEIKEDTIVLRREDEGWLIRFRKFNKYRGQWVVFGDYNSLEARGKTAKEVLRDYQNHLKLWKKAYKPPEILSRVGQKGETESEWEQSLISDPDWQAWFVERIEMAEAKRKKWPYTKRGLPKHQYSQELYLTFLGFLTK